ncbi:MAG: HipA domain-containing protein [Candidatus Protistobacter heckmanni]|nr:HipA domain-containing protein [Candidatus Protistobacter heckmanni]
MSRELDVFLEDTRAGRLHENAGIWSFGYDAAWLETGFPLAPGLPLQEGLLLDTGSKRPVQWFFDNLLLEEAARTRLIASVADDAAAPAWDAWRLLEHFGGESAGALSLMPPGQAAAPGLIPLSDERLEARILAMPHAPLAAEALKKMSLAGAQEKLPVVVDAQGRLFEPVGSEVSTHILKPDAPSAHFPASAVNEWFCARVAQTLGLDVPAVTLRHVPSTVYLIKRFDRTSMGSAPRRRHVLDAAQLLSLAAGAKYEMSGVLALQGVVALSRVKAATRIALFRWTLFNVLIGNGDAHLKNLSLFAGREGYVLAPHYDLVSTAAWARPDLMAQRERCWPNVELSFPIGGARYFEQLERQHLLQFAEALGLPAATANRELDRLINNVENAADQVLAECTAMPAPDRARAREMAMLRAIREVPVREMAAKLR